jgi:D-beta-D-heptose 7-phosphate kinase/D-beta-D-heptose 1-phosphate adenosyltransferase
VVSMAAAGLAAGLPLVIVAQLAAIAAGIAMGKTGIAVVREEDFLEALTPGRMAARKVVSRPQAVERVERWRRHGDRIGFLSGPAARISATAEALLEQARTWCDRLVVAVTGEGGEAAGAALADLSVVDLITTYEGTSAVELIRALRPDILVQSETVHQDSVPGGDLLQEWGGELRFASQTPEAAE